MSLDRRLKKLEVAIGPAEELRVICVDGTTEVNGVYINEPEDSPEYLRRLEQAKRDAGLEDYNGELLVVRFVTPDPEALRNR